MEWKGLMMNAAELEAVNTLCQWLGVNDWQEDRHFDAIVLAGNFAMPTLEMAFLTAQKSGKPLWMTGGVGHGTRFLIQAVRQHPRYAHLDVSNCSEAEIFAAMASCWQIPASQYVLESHSTNTGENAIFTLNLMASHRAFPRNILLMQDPLLQRRTGETFRYVWRHVKSQVRFINWPGWLPCFYAQGSGIRLQEYLPPWDAGYFLDLMMGEIPRLRNDSYGYGPRGKGFIGEVAIPDNVECAWQRLCQRGLGCGRLLAANSISSEALTSFGNKSNQ